MKLLVDTRSRRVLYAEARKDALDFPIAVDFLIFLLRVRDSLPREPDEGDADGT
jgi:hypothetical protein